MAEHQCKTQDGVIIKLGLAVIDYDGRQGVVVGEPAEYELADEVCWPCAGHQGHWWQVRPDDAPADARGGAFDGSRLTTRGVK